MNYEYPLEVLILIFEYLSLNDLHSVQLACRSFKPLVKFCCDYNRRFWNRLDYGIYHSALSILWGQMDTQKTNHDFTGVSKRLRSMLIDNDISSVLSGLEISRLCIVLQLYKKHFLQSIYARIRTDANNPGDGFVHEKEVSDLCRDYDRKYSAIISAEAKKVVVNGIEYYEQMAGKFKRDIYYWTVDCYNSNISVGIPSFIKDNVFHLNTEITLNTRFQLCFFPLSILLDCYCDDLIPAMVKHFPAECRLEMVKIMRYSAMENMDVMQFLIRDFGVNPNEIKNDDDQYVIHLVAMRNNASDILRMLLMVPCERINSQDSIKRTPLHYAVARCDYESVKMLLEHGADPNIKDEDQWTALEWAVWDDEDSGASPENQVKIIELLKSYGAHN